MQHTSRREFLVGAGGAALGLIAVSGVAGSLMACAKPGTAEADKQSTTTSNPPPPASTSTTPVVAAALATLPWPYQKLDPVAAAERAYTAYSNGGCMFGGFEGIIGELNARLGAPYNTFPSAMMKYGGGGVSGWGTLCGALNGVAAAIYLITDSKVSNPLINEVFGWYGATALPNYTPAKPKFAKIDTSIADSQLCHASVSTWCTKTGFKATSPERADRCAWLTASVVRFTADLLNKQADGAFKPTFAVPASVAACLSCHGKGGIIENVHTSNQTQCGSCHVDLGSKHPTVQK